MSRIASPSRKSAPASIPAPSTATPLNDRGEFRIAAIDIGSNSLHMAVAQADADGSITTLWRMKEMVGLGRISFPSRRLTREAIDRAVTTLRRFQEAAQSRRCEKIIAVATSAVREAENGGEFIDRVRRELNMRVRVISARDEARMIYLGVRHAIDLGDKPHFILDIGGGSVEFIVGDNNRAALLESRKLGATRMTAKYIDSDPISADDLKKLLGHYDREMGPVLESVAALKPVAAIGTSGTMENLAAMCASMYGKGSSSSDPMVLSRDPLARLVARLLESKSKDRATMHGLDDQRKDQVTAGALLVNELFHRLNLTEIRVCNSALREGLLVDYLSRHVPEMAIRRQVPDPRRRSVLDLARRCTWHQEHGEHVAKLTLELFDEMKSLHGLAGADRELIEYGAMLHDIGWHIARDQHHKHSMYLIQHGALKGFTQEEIAIIANIARYHRKSFPTDDHEPFADLSKRGKRVVSVGAALLRMADGLDRSHCQVISNLKCKVGKHGVDVTLKTRGDAELEIWSARSKADLFAETFERSVSFEEAE